MSISFEDSGELQRDIYEIDYMLQDMRLVAKRIVKLLKFKILQKEKWVWQKW